MAGGVPPNLHPERKGQLNRSPKKNWVEKFGDLPPYINSYATALKRQNPTWTIQKCIQVAISRLKSIAATGRLMQLPGRPKVRPAVRAAAIKAIAQWNAMRARAKASPG
jgi:hypothetical protein